jgi:hypothetical protein
MPSNEKRKNMKKKKFETQIFFNEECGSCSAVAACCATLVTASQRSRFQVCSMQDVGECPCKSPLRGNATGEPSRDTCFTSTICPVIARPTYFTLGRVSRHHPHVRADGVAHHPRRRRSARRALSQNGQRLRRRNERTRRTSRLDLRRLARHVGATAGAL